MEPCDVVEEIVPPLDKLASILHQHSKCFLENGGVVNVNLSGQEPRLMGRPRIPKTMSPKLFCNQILI